MEYKFTLKFSHERFSGQTTIHTLDQFFTLSRIGETYVARALIETDTHEISLKTKSDGRFRIFRTIKQSRFL